jgi:cytochrome P450
MEITTFFPPGPKSVFGLEGLTFRRDPLGFLTRLARRCGDIAHFRVGPQHVFLLNHPDYIRDVLVTNNQCFGRGRGLQRAKRLLGEGLLTSEGEPHRRQRRLIQPAFHRERVATHADLISKYSEKLAARWRDGETRDMLREMRHLTLATVGRSLFSADMETDTDAIIEELTASVNLLDLFGAPKGRFLTLLRTLPVIGPKRFTWARERLDAIIYRIINERRLSGHDRGDLLSALLTAQDGEGGMSDGQVRDEVMTLIQAGHETAANALAWTWYLLARNAEAEAKLHDELDSVLAGRTPTFDDLARLPYTEKVFLEAMRMYPPVWTMTRLALKDYAVGGYTLPAGSLVLISQYVMHHDERYYPDPHRYDPERWSPEARQSRPQFTYFPFGGGPRRCIGEGLAMLEGVLMIATLANRWRMRLATTRPVRTQTSIVLRPKDGMPMRLEHRGDLTAGRGPFGNI